MNILVTGGAGYIGSHTCVQLLNAGYEVTVLDNLYNSCEEALNRIRTITGREIQFYKEDLLNYDGVERIFQAQHFDAVIHFAGLKAVGESVSIPPGVTTTTTLPARCTCASLWRNTAVKSWCSAPAQPFTAIRLPFQLQRISRCTQPTPTAAPS